MFQRFHQQLTSSLAVLKLEAHSSLEDCKMLQAFCHAGLGSLAEAERELRDVAKRMQHLKLRGAASGHVRDRLFLCTKAAGRLREVMHDFVAASGDYTECAQTWTLADDEISAQHPFVAGRISQKSELWSIHAIHAVCLTGN